MVGIVMYLHLRSPIHYPFGRAMEGLIEVTNTLSTPEHTLVLWSMLLDLLKDTWLCVYACHSTVVVSNRDDHTNP